MDPKIRKIQEDFRRLRLHARCLTDMEDTRKALVNRLGANISVDRDEPINRKSVEFQQFLYSNLELDPRFLALETDEDRKAFLKAERPQTLYGLVKTAEKTAEQTLINTMRSINGPHMTEFVDSPGMGPKTIARILGEVGHPVIAFPMEWMENDEAVEGSKKIADRKRVLVPAESGPYERMVSQLWSYCGHGNPERKHKENMSQEDALACGSVNAKKMVHYLATLQVRMTGEPDKNGVSKARSLYRDDYEEIKAHYIEKRPEWTPGHQQNATLRKVGKIILKDMWVAAREDLLIDA